MEHQYKVCCGLDVHKKLLVACLRTGRKTEIRECGASTREILELADWLLENQCECAAMESTGSYWKPVYNIFESCELNPIVVNAQHMRNVPGRKTDIKDAEWISDLLMNGLLRSSYIPGRQQRELRELCIYRTSLIKTRAAELNRQQKLLEGGNFKISGTISNINGMSGETLMQYIISGETFDEQAYAKELKAKRISKRLKASPQELVRDMEGCFTPAQSRLLATVVRHTHDLDRLIEELDRQIEELLQDEQEEAIELIKGIPGISDRSAQVIVSAIGTDMSRFPTDKHLCSWAGLCPGNHESAGKRKNGRTNKGNKSLKSTLVVCAHSAVMVKDSCFGAMYRRISRRRGKKKAIVAVAHAMLKTIFHMLKNHEPYHDLGADFYERQEKEGKVKSCLKKLYKLGVNLTGSQIDLMTGRELLQT